MAKLTKDQITLLKKWVISPRLVDKITDDTKQVEIRKAKVQCFSLRVFESIFGYDATTGKFTIKGGGTAPVDPIATAKIALADFAKLLVKDGIVFQNSGQVATDQTWVKSIAKTADMPAGKITALNDALKLLDSAQFEFVFTGTRPTAGIDASLHEGGTVKGKVTNIAVTHLRSLDKAGNWELDVQPWIEVETAQSTTEVHVIGINGMNADWQNYFKTVTVKFVSGADDQTYKDAITKALD